MNDHQQPITEPKSPLELVFYPEPILRRQAQALRKVGDALRDRAREMFDLMYREGGVGLAAPQVGWGARIFVVNTSAEHDPESERVYINPEITHAEGEETDEEGCLSIPGLRGKVSRSHRVVVRALDLEGELFEEEAEELHARVIQHELDHLDGILFFVRLSASERLLAGKVLKQLEREYKESRREAR